MKKTADNFTAILSKTIAFSWLLCYNEDNTSSTEQAYIVQL